MLCILKRWQPGGITGKKKRRESRSFEERVKKPPGRTVCGLYFLFCFYPLCRFLDIPPSLRTYVVDACVCKCIYLELRIIYRNSGFII